MSESTRSRARSKPAIDRAGGGRRAHQANRDWLAALRAFFQGGRIADGDTRSCARRPPRIPSSHASLPAYSGKKAARLERSSFSGPRVWEDP